MKKGKKHQARKEQEELIAQMEYEDSVGIRRKRFKPLFFTAKRLIIFRIALIALALLMAFLWSPALIIIMSLYGSMYFITKHTEREENFGVKKHHQIKLFKVDCLLAVVLVAFCVGGTVLSAVTTSTRSSMFEGRSEAQIRAMMSERGMSESRVDSMLEHMEEQGMFLTSFERNLLTIATCYTGHRELFQTKNRMAVQTGISFGRRMVRREAPSGDAPVSGDAGFVGEGGDRVIIGGANGGAMGAIPFTRIVNQIISAIAFILIIVTGISGIIVIILSRKTLRTTG